MELQYHGANCLKITTKKATLVVDDNLKALGGKAVSKSDNVSLVTNKEVIKAEPTDFVLDSPGEYEMQDVVIKGVGVRAHMDEEGKANAVIYTVTAGDTTTAITGHIHPNLTDDELEAIGLVDVLVLPVGGNGYTLDPVGALQVVKKIEPKIIIPVHYDDKSLKYEVPQQPLEEALKAFGMEPLEKTDKYKIKPSELSESTHLVIIEKS